MEKVKYITISGFDFLITDELDYNSDHYYLAIDEAGEDTIVVLKEKVVDGKRIAEALDDENQIKFMLDMFYKKNS